MNTPTLSELTRIARTAMEDALRESKEIVCGVPRGLKHDVAYYAVTAVLDAVGYTFPVDPEREAFDAWLKEATCLEGENLLFEAWKAGRAARDKEARLDKKPNSEADPPWIEWKGGKCPIPDTVKRWEYRLRGGYQCSDPGCPPSAYDWEGKGALCPVVAYRILDGGTTKQPE